MPVSAMLPEINSTRRPQRCAPAFQTCARSWRLMPSISFPLRRKRPFRFPQSRSFHPLPNPDKILCIGLNYAAHIKETGREKPKYPSIFTRYPSSIRGNDQPLLKPSISDEFDYEGELAVIIGKPGRNIRAADAADHILGYSCFNDGTIRDFQRHTTQFWPGKSFDDTGSMGPWVVTKDELPNPEETASADAVEWSGSAVHARLRSCLQHR